MPRKRYCISNIIDAGRVHDEPLESHAKAPVRDGPVASQIEIPLELRGVHASPPQRALETIKALLAQTAADKFSDARNKEIDGRDRLVIGAGPGIIVDAHVKGLDGTRVVDDKEGALDVLAREILLVLEMQPVPLFFG